MDVRFIPCTLEAHGEAILAILNEAIVTSTALYDYRPRTPESMLAWFASKVAGAYPVIGAVDGAGSLLGFASYGPFRAFPGYKYTVEHSIYVHRDHRGRGLGRALLEHLVEAARQRDVHVLVGVIDMANRGSIALHEQLGFVHAGVLHQVGFKFGGWLDVGFWQRTLDTPADPRDG
ncbi:GNAT family N-acetyltransferase [Zoogloea sp.]|uniref:GNAT family N-acetyltransferase n=1 Tax=Zoogloea sp. TaxID=49181 RepID=UPI0026126C77|nr:GNAT family N-acetyltransferase [Zoogloea sp.]MDD3352450.1 GNAT family N-acetyltransferase [Zoogloea sp.]